MLRELLHFAGGIAEQNVYWPRPSVCMCVCVSVCLAVPRRIPTLLHGPGRNLRNERGAYWADLRSMHGFRCYDNTHVCKLIASCTASTYSAEREMSACACTRSTVGSTCCCLIF